MINREILFRGIRKDSREWVEGIPVESNMNGEGYETFMYTDYTVHNAISLVVGGGYFGQCVEVIPETVGQLTGLLDKNGTKIFEGSMIKSSRFNNDVVCEVVFSNGTYCLHTTFDDGKPYPISECRPLEVIGTIHDHLLEANNE